LKVTDLLITAKTIILRSNANDLQFSIVGLSTKVSSRPKTETKTKKLKKNHIDRHPQWPFECLELISIYCILSPVFLVRL